MSVSAASLPEAALRDKALDARSQRPAQTSPLEEENRRLREHLESHKQEDGSQRTDFKAEDRRSEAPMARLIDWPIRACAETTQGGAGHFHFQNLLGSSKSGHDGHLETRHDQYEASAALRSYHSAPLASLGCL